MQYLNNKILSFDNQEVNASDIFITEKTGSLGINYYDPIQIRKLQNFFRTLPSGYFGTMKIKNNICLEKISLDLYKDSSYWDLLLLLNLRTGIFEMPYDNDVLYNSVEYNLEYYETKVLKRRLSDKQREEFKERNLEKLSNENDEYKTIKYIYSDMIYTVIQNLYEADLI